MSTADTSTWSSSRDERTGRDRRTSPRRAARRPYDPLFATILVNQIAPAETIYVQGYGGAEPTLRRGAKINFRA